jgi:hypothetical protein
LEVGRRPDGIEPKIAVETMNTMISHDTQENEAIMYRTSKSQLRTAAMDIASQMRR